MRGHGPTFARKLLQATGQDFVWGLPRARAIAALLTIGFASGIIISLLILCIKRIRSRRTSGPTSSTDSSVLPAVPTEMGVDPRSASKRGFLSRGLPPLAPVGPLGAGVAATMAATSPVHRSMPPARRSSPALIPAAIFTAADGQVIVSGRISREGSLRASSPAALGRSPRAGGTGGGDLSRGVSIGPLDRFLSCVSEEDDEYLRSPSAPPAPESEEEEKEENKDGGGEGLEVCEPEGAGGNPFATTEEAVAAHKQALLELEAAKLGLTLVKKKEGGEAAAAAEAGQQRREGGSAQGPRSLALKLEEAAAEGAKS